MVRSSILSFIAHWSFSIGEEMVVASVFHDCASLFNQIRFVDYRLYIIPERFQALAGHDWQAGIDRRVKSAAFYVQFLKVFTESRMFAVRDLNNSVKLAMAFLVNFEFFELFPIRGNVAEIPVEPDNQRRFRKRRG